MSSLSGILSGKQREILVAGQASFFPLFPSPQRGEGKGKKEPGKFPRDAVKREKSVGNSVGKFGGKT